MHMCRKTVIFLQKKRYFLFQPIDIRKLLIFNVFIDGQKIGSLLMLPKFRRLDRFPITYPPTYPQYLWKEY